MATGDFNAMMRTVFDRSRHRRESEREGAANRCSADPRVRGGMPGARPDLSDHGGVPGVCLTILHGRLPCGVLDRRPATEKADR
jgi:hypothetical protein